MQASLACQVGEKEENGVWDGHDDQQNGFFFLCGVSASSFSCDEEESGGGDNLHGEKKKKKESGDDSAPWTENGYVGEVNGLFPGLCDASWSD
jgi:hypothetical protein